MEEPKNGNYRLRHILIKPTYTSEELLEPTRFLDSIADLIRADSITFEDAAREFSEDPLTKMNGGLVSNHDSCRATPTIRTLNIRPRSSVRRTSARGAA